MIDTLHQFCKCVGRTAYRMVGIPDYDAYARHWQSLHPDEPVMTYEEFYREVQRRRYTAEPGKFKCSCC